MDRLEPFDELLENYEVSKMIKDAKKPKFHVEGDIFVEHLNKFCDFLALPLTDIFNHVLCHQVWQTRWKQETLVVIPKCTSPQSLSECRNLSCTQFFSKTLERVVFDWLNKEICLSDAQYGGRKGCGVNHMLVDAWTTILHDLEEPGSSSNIISLNFEKTFNRLDHKACVESLREHGASHLTQNLIASFLLGRTMWAKIGDVLSSPRNINGGSPQGSILGCLLFSITTDGLDRNIDYGPPPLNTCDMEDNPGNRTLNIDLSLALIRTEERSDLGINNITVEADLDGACVSFDRNGTDVSSPALPKNKKFHQSTPTSRGQFEDFIPPGNLVNACLSDTYSSTAELTFVYMASGRRAPHPDLVSSSSASTPWTSMLAGDLCMTAESNTDSARNFVMPYVYVDVTNGVERISHESGQYHFSTKKMEMIVHAKQSERFFHEVRRRAEKIGMKLNTRKTKMLCLSSNPSYDIKTYIEIDGEKIFSQDSLRITGFTFDSRPSVQQHITSMKSSFYSRLWSTRNLKRAGFSRQDLVDFYCSLVLPVLDYCAVVYNSFLTSKQVEELERMQKHAVRIIVGQYRLYTETCASLRIEKLVERRKTQVEKFATRAVETEDSALTGSPSKEITATVLEDKIISSKINQTQNE